MTPTPILPFIRPILLCPQGVCQLLSDGPGLVVFSEYYSPYHQPHDACHPPTCHPQGVRQLLGNSKLSYEAAVGEQQDFLRSKNRLLRFEMGANQLTNAIKDVLSNDEVG